MFFPEKCLKLDIVIVNGFLSEVEHTYPLNKETQYKCKPGYVTADGKTSGLVKCLEDGWSIQPICISKWLYFYAFSEHNSTKFILIIILPYRFTWLHIK